MSKTNETPKADTARPLFRVNYRYIVNYQLRNQSYIIPAADTAEAEKKASELLANRFGKSGTEYKITSTKPFGE